MILPNRQLEYGVSNEDAPDTDTTDARADLRAALRSVERTEGDTYHVDHEFRLQVAIVETLHSRAAIVDMHDRHALVSAHRMRDELTHSLVEHGFTVDRREGGDQ